MAGQHTGYDLLGLQRRIAIRVRYGGSEADIEREIIEPAGLAPSQVPALRLYALSQIELHRAREARTPEADQPAM